ncbi:hypothetical protein O6H91_Y469500 [Diphasiastrum complanatum]|nr:hypothetical protein O6H91_Y469500 [Diphasiastrum complanatum]
MARIILQAFRENDRNCTSWSLRSSAEESDLVIRLRKNGFYAGHSNLEDLKSFCLQNFNPFQVPLKAELPVATIWDDDACAERDNLRSDSQKLDSTVQKIVEFSCIMKKDVTDTQKNKCDKDLPEDKLEVQNPVTTSLCLALSKSKRTESMSSRFGDVPYTILDRSRNAIQRCHTFQDDDVSSGDDAEVVPDFVECFYVTDENDKVISLFVLPYASSTPRENSLLGRFYLHGKYDNGLHPFMHAITMWKLELGETSYFSVKTLAGNWIRLGQPSKSYAGGQLRTALVVKKFLSFVNINRAASEKMVWAHLTKEFRFLDFQPSVDDLLQHKEIIKRLATQIPDLDCTTVIGEFLSYHLLAECVE